jgi:hypothetical protein
MFVWDCQALIGYGGEFDGGDLLSSASRIAQLLLTVDFSAQANWSAHARFNPTGRQICCGRNCRRNFFCNQKAI